MGHEFGGKRAFRKIAAGLLLLLLAAAVPIAWMYREATSDPVVRATELNVAGLGAPVRLLLLSDMHVAGPDMPPRRLRRIVGQINALKPDIVLIAGDLVSDKRLSTHAYTVADAVAPLRGLRARIGTVAVLGNHDHWRDAEATRVQLASAGVRVLDNHAVRVGPLTIGGVADPYTAHDRLAPTLRAMRSLPQPFILLSHSPDIFPAVPPDVPLTLAGHTHCGQIRLPLIGAVSTMSNYGERYGCGRVDERGRTLVVSAGLGTSILPLRLGAPPDVWMIRLRPKLSEVSRPSPRG